MERSALIRIGLVLFVIGVALFSIYTLIMILLPFLVAYILQFGLKPLIVYLEQRGLRPTVSVMIVFFLFFSMMGVFIYLVFPLAINEVQQLQSSYPRYRALFFDTLSTLEATLLGNVPGLRDHLNSEGYTLNLMVENSMKGMISRLPSVLISSIPLVLYLVIIPFATLYFLLDQSRLRKKFISLVPNRYFEMTLNLLHSLHVQFGMLLVGMALTVAVMSVLVSLGLWMIDLKFPIMVGIFAGVANLIPYAGPVVGSICAFIVAIITGAPTMIYLHIFLVFSIANLIENILIQPLILGRVANLHPLLVIFLILLGSQLGGVIGMLVIVPLASLVQVVFRILYQQFSRPVRPPFSEYRERTATECPE